MAPTYWNGLRNLCMAGFNQGWVEDHENYQAVIDRFYVENSVAGIQQTIDEVDEMLADDPDEKELGVRFVGAGAEVHADGIELTYREIVDYIRTRGVAELKRRPPRFAGQRDEV